jgi:hypothetical protein
VQGAFREHTYAGLLTSTCISGYACCLSGLAVCSLPCLPLTCPVDGGLLGWRLGWPPRPASSPTAITTTTSPRWHSTHGSPRCPHPHADHRAQAGGGLAPHWPHRKLNDSEAASTPETTRARSAPL